MGQILGLQYEDFACSSPLNVSKRNNMSGHGYSIFISFWEILSKRDC